MKLIYDRKADTLTLRLREGNDQQSDEVQPGIIFDYDARKTSDRDDAHPFLAVGNDARPTFSIPKEIKPLPMSVARRQRQFEGVILGQGLPLTPEGVESGIAKVCFQSAAQPVETISLF